MGAQEAKTCKRGRKGSGARATAKERRVAAVQAEVKALHAEAEAWKQKAQESARAVALKVLDTIRSNIEQRKTGKELYEALGRLCESCAVLGSKL